MKKYFFFAATALAFTACTSDDFIGTEKTENGAEEMAITFSGGAGKVQRATQTGADAADLLGGEFVLYGWKTTSSTVQKVYDHYTVKYADGSALSTPSNTAGWEYVGQTLNMLTSLDKANGAEQEIKYWDLAADQYDFVAFALGAARQVEAEGDIEDGKVYVTAITPTSTPVAPDTYTGPKYTIKGAAEDLAKVYIADRVSAQASGAEKANLFYNYKNAIQFNFRSLGSKVRMGIYETIPGYSVTNVKFYDADGLLADGDQAPTLYAADATIPGGEGTMTITFGPNDVTTKTDYNKAFASFEATDDDTNTENLTFGNIGLKAKEKVESSSIATQFLGRRSTIGSDKMDVSICDYVTVLPATAGALTLTVDYTLVPLDGSDAVIKVTGATATVPAQYCTWQPNYAYTYLFKITDKTSGTIGDDPAGLYPITFDAIVTETEDGVQETITTVATPSITTYAKGVNPTVAATAEYATDSNIYVSVNGATLSASNSKLYTATQAKVSGELQPAQEITEESVANAIANDQDGTPGAPYVVTDANNWRLTVATASVSLSEATEIDKDDAPDGNAISGNFMKFTPTAAGTYVFEYTVDATHKYYKVIKVAAGS